MEPLFDARYDSEYEIMPHLVMGRTAEDVLEGANYYDRDPDVG